MDRRAPQAAPLQTTTVAMALLLLLLLVCVTEAGTSTVSRFSQLLHGDSVLKSPAQLEERHQISLLARQIDVRMEPPFDLNTYFLKKRQFLADIPSSLLHDPINGGTDDQQQQQEQLLPVQVLVQLSDPAQRQQVESALGVKLETQFYVPSDAYAILLRPNQLETELPTLLQQGTLTWAGHFSPEFKTLLNLQNRDSAPLEVRDVRLSVIINALPSEIDTLIKLWQSRFTSAYGPKSVLFSRVSDRKILVEASSRIAGSVQRVLQAHEQVHWIERKLPSSVKNQFARSILQAGSGTDHTFTPIWGHGITGEGQIVGVGDTGIDHDNCFFDDPLQPLPIDSVNPQHRKIISYNTVTVTIDGHTYTSDTKDGIDGHGTHVVGSVAGAIQSWSSNFFVLGAWNGSAPNAKIVFHDFENQAVSDYLLIPDDLNEVFAPAYAAGARIHSNSWGCSIGFLSCAYDCDCYFTVDIDGYHRGQRAPSNWCRYNFGQDCCRICNHYDSQAQDVDAFAFSNPDFLILFANGNDGDSSSYGTLGTPATCKNCISVGASQTANFNFLLTSSYTDIQHNLETAGFLTESECCSYTSEDKLFEKRIKLHCCRSFMQTEYQDTSTYSHNNVASFSSKGPAFDNRIKPDIVAPGNVVHSMHSDGNPNSHQCGTQSPGLSNPAAIMAMSGTSMATPLTAGVVSLVRQYFVDGFYPSGHKNISASISPPAALLKAMIVHSAQQLPGKVMMGDGTFETLGSTPNKHEGFGLINLSNALYFKDSSTFGLFVEPSTPLKPDEVVSFCFRSTSTNADFKATLVWFDPAGSLSSSRAIVNDLDLIVDHDSKLHFANGGSYLDSINTVEQILVDNVKFNQTVSVYVRATSIKNDKQSFSLVVTGGTFQTDCIAPPLNLPSILPLGTILLILFCCCCCIPILFVCLGLVLIVCSAVVCGKLAGMSQSSTSTNPTGYNQMPDILPNPQSASVTVTQQQPGFSGPGYFGQPGTTYPPSQQFVQPLPQQQPHPGQMQGFYPGQTQPYYPNQQQQ